MKKSISKKNTLERLRAFLKMRPADAASICAHLQISQPTFSRLQRESVADIVGFGAARSTQYGLARSIAGVGSVLSLFYVNADGASLPFGELHTLQNDWYVFTPAGGASPQAMLGLPFFLQDVRPQGFLGRLIPNLHQDIGLPSKINNWTDDDTLMYLARRGEDAAGNLIVGNESYRRFLMRNASGDVDNGNQRAVTESSRAAAYADLAYRANNGDVVGSSAGGEQPKFTSTVIRKDGRTENVIVKFSPLISTESGRRWADLLIAEHLAMASLNKHGIAACQSQIIVTDARIYLEVTRFDRIGLSGRAPIVSLAGIDGLLGSLDKNWSYSAGLMTDKRYLSIADRDTIRLLDLFGALIGNTDRHPGNLSLFWNLGNNFGLAPVYDMLPMMYRPNTQGEIVDRHFKITILETLDLRFLDQAKIIAIDFWKSVINDTRITNDFKQIAQRHAQAVMKIPIIG